jgi:predicted DCC family thiol-disulfide oxidoreductase YuxK
MNEIEQVVVIYDGQCDFCWQSITWVRKRCEITALAYQSSDLDQFGLTQEECVERVYVVADGQMYAAAAAVAYLFQYRGNKVLGLLLRKSGFLGEFGYRAVAGNRGSIVVRAATRYLKFLNQS